MPKKKGIQPIQTREALKVETPVESISWKVWPLAQDAGKAFLALASLIFFPVLFYFTGGRLLGLALFAFIVLLVSIAGFLFPAAYSVSEREIRIRHIGVTVVRKKSDFRRVVFYPEAVLFSPFPRANFLDYYRGVFVKLPSKPSFELQRLKPLFEHGIQAVDVAGAPPVSVAKGAK